MTRLLSVADPSSTNTGQLVNGTFALPQHAAGPGRQRRQHARPVAPVGGSSAPDTLLTWTAPISNDAVTMTFKQHVSRTDALRTGTYSKTLTFTLSTTTP